jgi:glycerol-3-phosphate dehydrogenase
MISDKKILKLTKEFADTFPDIAVTIHDDVVFLDGELDNYEQVIAAGFLAVEAKGEGIVNRIKWRGYSEPPMRVAPIVDQSLDGIEVDVLIIGGGIVGCAIARELSKYQLKTLLVEKENDVALHASSRNDGVIHIGIDLKVKSQKYRFLRQAVPLYKQLTDELKVPYNRQGQVIAFSKKWMRHFMFLLNRKAKHRQIFGMEIWKRERLLQEVPSIGNEIEFAAFFPDGATICPYETAIALAENAIQNGVKISLDTAVTGMKIVDRRIVEVTTNRGSIRPFIVINAAGTFSDKVAAMAQDQFFTIHPRKGVELILDKKARARGTNRSISLYRGASDRQKDHSKGGGIIPTVDGNVLIGPTAYETPEREDFSTDSDSVRQLFERHKSMLPQLRPSDVITYFSGIRAATYEEDFIVRIGKWTKNIIHAAGIQSPGLTAAPGIAQEIARLVKIVHGRPLTNNPGFDPNRKVTTPTHRLEETDRDAMIKNNPDYGQIVCRCEEISRGEIIDALHRPLVVPTIDGIKRRVRAGMGRCQGGFCGPLVTKIIHDELKIDYKDIYKKGHGSLILKGTKDDTYGNI